MSAGSFRHLREGTNLANASYGKAVERLSARIIQEDKLLNSLFHHTGRARGPNGRFISSPDFIGMEPGRTRLFDVTTEAAIPKHLNRPGFGRISEFIIYPSLTPTQFR